MERPWLATTAAAVAKLQQQSRQQWKIRVDHLQIGNAGAVKVASKLVVRKDIPEVDCKILQI